ncbi:hypothetical protein [Trichothermofontia sp.]
MVIREITQPAIPHDIEEVSEKLAYFSHHKDTYDVIFIGSSRTHRQIMPVVFDQVLKSQGYRVRSFNLGIGGSYLPETYFYIRQVLAMRPKKLKWIFVEYTDKLDAREENVRATREVHWHTLGETWHISQVIFRSNHDWWDKLVMTFDHLHSYVYGLIRNGKGAAFIQNHLIGYHNDDREHKISLLGRHKDGYISYDEDPDRYVKMRRKKFLRKLNQYHQDVQKLITRRQQSESYQPFKPEFLGSMVARIQNHGIEPIFIVPPSLHTYKDLIQSHRQHYVPTLFIFNDPQLFPHLYAVENRFDDEHLNQRGSEAFTHLLAQAFIQYLADSKMESP